MKVMVELIAMGRDGEVAIEVNDEATADSLLDVLGLRNGETSTLPTTWRGSRGRCRPLSSRASSSDPLRSIRRLPPSFSFPVSSSSSLPSASVRGRPGPWRDREPFDAVEAFIARWRAVSD